MIFSCHTFTETETGHEMALLNQSINVRDEAIASRFEAERGRTTEHPQGLGKRLTPKVFASRRSTPKAFGAVRWRAANVQRPSQSARASSFVIPIIPSVLVIPFGA